MKAQRILVVEDDEHVQSLLSKKLTAEGYEVFTATDGPEALEIVSQQGLPHLVLIDLTLPTMPGFELSHRLKGLGDVPIIFLSATDDLDTMVKGLTHYAEDYIVKPFQLPLLMARIKRVLLRFGDFEYANEPVLHVDERLSIDFGNGRIVVEGTEISLTRTEASLLHVLVRNKGHVVPSRTLIGRVWPAREIFEDTLRVHIHRLRRKVEADLSNPKYIRTERGMGYSFINFPVDAGDDSD